ncbi:MAG: GntR family transcriptional regulator [Bacteroidales bacterium]|nr:GntR family transcriptional regulator [Bacteroidales bacterium]
MSIDFKSTKGIFQQIADTLAHRILEGLLKPGDRVPSVRDLAEEFEVNRNTLLRTYALMQEAGIIENRRGVGFFVTSGAVERIQMQERTAFFANDLPEFIHKVKLLRLTSDELSELMAVIQNNDPHENKQ